MQDDLIARCTTCGETNRALFCSNGFHGPQSVDARIAALEADNARLASFIMHCIEGEPSQSKGAIDAAIRVLTDYGTQTGELLADNARLMGLVKEAGEASASVIGQAFDHYTARNGRKCSIEGDDGEKCWIVPFDAFEQLRATLAKIKEATDAE